MFNRNYVYHDFFTSTIIEMRHHPHAEPTCSRTYFVILHMHIICMCMREILHTHAHEILMPFITQKTQAKTLKITFF